MNILHIETSPTWGGQEFRTLEEVQWLNRHGHRSWLVCQPDSEVRKMAEKLQIPFLAVPVKRGVSLGALQQVLRLLQREKIEVIHTHSSKDSSLSLPLYLMGWPVVRSRHLLLGSKTGLNRTFSYRYGCTRVIATAGAIRDALTSSFRVPAEKVDIVGEGVDLRKFNPAVEGIPFRKRLGVPSGMPLVGMVAMVRSEKGPWQFIEAALLVLKNNPDVRFVVAGNATDNMRDYEERCRNRIQEAGASESILMPGYIEDVPGVLAGLDIVVVPSLSEAQSRVVPEAFAMRKPVIASRVGGLPELVHDGITGLLVPPGDSPALAHALQRLLDDPALRNKLAQAGYDKACAELSFDQMMKKTLGVYQKMAIEK